MKKHRLQPWVPRAPDGVRVLRRFVTGSFQSAFSGFERQKPIDIKVFFIPGGFVVIRAPAFSPDGVYGYAVEKRLPDGHFWIDTDTLEHLPKPPTWLEVVENQVLKGSIEDVPSLKFSRTQFELHPDPLVMAYVDALPESALGDKKYLVTAQVHQNTLVDHDLESRVSHFFLNVSSATDLELFGWRQLAQRLGK